MTERRVALDTNLLVYAEGIAPLERDRGKPGRARDLLARLPGASVVLPVQALGELYRVLTGKAGRSPPAACEAILGWRDAFATVDTTAAAMVAAFDLAADHRLSIWDAVILAAAAEAGCRLLLSEDMQDGFTWRGVTVTDPFGDGVHPLLASTLG